MKYDCVDTVLKRKLRNHRTEDEETSEKNTGVLSSMLVSKVLLTLTHDKTQLPSFKSKNTIHL